ncbi:MAG: hypothetical protein ACXW04_00105 [Methylobacter sp.]
MPAREKILIYLSRLGKIAPPTLIVAQARFEKPDGLHIDLIVKEAGRGITLGPCTLALRSA